MESVTDNLRFNAIDVSVLILYFLVVFVTGFYFSRKLKGPEDYFLAGRSLVWYVVGASLFATNISSEHLIGLSSLGASSGFAGAIFEWIACIMLIALAWVFAPAYIKAGVYTMPEYLEKRFDHRSRWIFSVMSILGYILTKISVILFSGSILLKALLGWDMYTSSLVLVLVTGFYTVGGGLSAVVYTGAIQTLIIIVGAIVLTVVGLNEVGGWVGLQASVPADYFHIFKPVDHPDFPWTGMVFGNLISATWYWCTDQFMVQRILGAQNVRYARRGALMAGYLKILPVFIIILPGIIAKALYPDLAANTAYPRIVTELLPTGARGIVVASLLAALMSSLAACFNSSATLFTLDIYQKLYPRASEFRLMNVGRLITFVVVILGIIWVPFISSLSGEIFVYLQKVQGYLAPPVAAVFLTGMLWKKANAKGALATLVVGIGIGTVRFVLELMHGPQQDYFTGPLKTIIEINFLHFSIIMFGIAVLVMVLTSISTAWEEAKRQYTYRALVYKASGSEVKPYAGTVTATWILLVVVGVLWFYFA